MINDVNISNTNSLTLRYFLQKAALSANGIPKGMLLIVGVLFTLWTVVELTI